MSGLTSVLSLGSAATGLAGSFADAQSIRAQGDYQNEMAKINAKYAEFSAESAIKRGDKAATDVKKQTKKLIGSQRAALAAQGIQIDSGSALDVQEDTAMIGQQEALKIKNNAWMEAFGFKVQAQQDTQQGKIAKMAANNTASATIATGGWQAVSGGLDAISKSNTYQNAMAPKGKDKE